MPLLREVLYGAVAVLFCAAAPATGAAAQDVAAAKVPADSHVADNAVGHFDYYLLDVVPAQEFCRIKDVGPGCVRPAGFAVHGLWPQNKDDTWPQFCSKQPVSLDLRGNLDITPDMTLLQHEWDKHGTCSGLSGAEYFAAEHRVRAAITVPVALLTATANRTFTPTYLLNMFYQVNPTLPPGSLSLSCREGRLTAVEACFDKSLQATACAGLRGCEATAISVE